MRSSITRVAALVITLAAGPIASAAVSAPPIDGEPVLATRIDGDVEIDPQGAVTAYRPMTQQPEPLATRLHDMVMRMRFEPVVDNGRAVHARARMRLSLVGTPDEHGGVSVRVEHVAFATEPSNPISGEADGGPSAVEATAVHKAMPRYPEPARRAGLSGRVIVAVRLGLDGRVLDAAVRDTALFNVKGTARQVQPYIADFENASLRAIRQWTFKVTLHPGATPTADDMTGLIPVVYAMEDDPTPGMGKWAWELRTLSRPVPWITPQLAAELPDSDEVSDGGTFGRANARFRVVDGSAGAL